MVQPPSSFIISSTEAENLANSKNLTLPQLLPSLLKSAQLLARPLISNFSVGAVGLSSDGRVFFGANVEFENLPLHHTIHAEQFLITNIAAHGGGPKVMNIAVTAAPCGHCRQFLQELRGVDDIKIVITDQEQVYEPVYEAFSAILPYAFGPCDLLDHTHPLILEKCSNEISLKDEIFEAIKGNEPDLGDGLRETIDKNEEFVGNEGFTAARGSHAPLKSSVVSDTEILSNGFSELAKDEGFAAARGSHAPVEMGVVIDASDLSNGYSELIDENEEILKREAFAAARGSHAPYSGCPSGVALMDCEGKVYKGSYMESAACNPRGYG
ncbi:cytidine/deoxycytidylate deaminase family protein [Artemisia annua]|uniref:cytidine deaminase n=1 Tax=Artemisia annua TaxID=35608 RepID=A0A2U1NE94_ARTAN|nr:cytidine/deoxycytidylate deaminase family protein [Artemisia annua]